MSSDAFFNFLMECTVWQTEYYFMAVTTEGEEGDFKVNLNLFLDKSGKIMHHFLF